MKRVSSLSSSSSKLLSFTVPLIMIFGFVALMGPNYNKSNWVFSSNYHPWIWSSVIPFSSSSSSSSSSTLSSNSTKTESPVWAKKESGVHIDLRPIMVGLNHGEEAVSEDFNLNRSYTPPLGIEAVEIQEFIEKKEQKINHVTSGPQIASSMNETHALPMTVRLGKNYSDLERLEAGLGLARGAIREAKKGNQTMDDSDYVPTGPMYWNANAFHRSYLEMEKQFKVYVYEEGEPPIFHHGPCGSIYAMEGNFINQIEISHFRTKNPEKAHVYFLPFSVASMVRFIYERDSHDWSPMRRAVRDYIDVIAGKYHYWNRSLAADHFMLACHDWGPELSFSHPYLYKNAIRALCNANTSEKFNPSKDVSFPEILLPGGKTKGLLGGPSPSQRPILVFFAGGVHGPIRPVLLDHWEGKDENVQIHKYLPKGVSYSGMLRKSKYCICASGYEVASPRMVEALYMGCVPVLIKDHYVAPFSDVLNWKTFSVEIKVNDIPNLKKILLGISQRRYIRMQMRGVQVRRHFEINLHPKRYDVFHMILHSIWLRRLNVHVHDIEQL